jgi:hypothetical protein
VNAFRTALKIAAATTIIGMTLVIAPSFASEPTAYAAPAAPTMSFDPNAPLNTAQIDDQRPIVDEIQNFPGGLTVVLSTGVHLTCRDFDTISPTDECNSADTVQHYYTLTHRQWIGN